MKYRQLGIYGIKLSEIGYGTWLTVGHGIDINASKKCITASLDNGINFFDSSDAYGRGEAEKTLGKILFEELEIYRDNLVIATKCYWPMSDNVNDRGLSRKYSGGSIPEDSRAANDKMNAFLKDRLTPDLLGKVDRLKSVADEVGVSLAQLSLAWCLRTKNVTSAIIGASKKKQVAENCMAVEIEFTPELEQKVKEIFS